MKTDTFGRQVMCVFLLLTQPELEETVAGLRLICSTHKRKVATCRVLSL